MTGPAIDPIALTQDLIRCPSITPRDEGALDIVQQALEGLGFDCHRLVFSEAGTADVGNLYARFGRGAPNLCFAGHTDVVPAGDLADWQTGPFAAIIEDGRLKGRGAADMKGAIAAYIAALAAFLGATGGKFPGSLSLLITGDEEGAAINGTAKVLRWLEEKGEKLDFCLVGEPTSCETLGDMIKIGRRGSLSGEITVIGIGGHVAYPDLAKNPIPGLAKIITMLKAEPLDQGTEHFPPSNLEVINIEIGNAAGNVIPARAGAAFNIRFNNLHEPDDLKEKVRRACEASGFEYELSFRLFGDAFLSPESALQSAVLHAIEEKTGALPELSTTGGTSDARYIKNHCPVTEFGLVGKTIHKPNEEAAVSDIAAISDIYHNILQHFFRA